jgi:O-antigen/teichoic acid export membrane protein
MTEPLTRFVTDTTKNRMAILHRALLWLVAAVLLAFVTGLTVGPTVVSWFFGSDRALSALQTALVAFGLTLAMAGVIAILILLVLGASRRATLIWLLGVTVAVVLGVWGVGIPLAFALAETGTVCLAVVAIRAQLRRNIDSPTA